MRGRWAASVIGGAALLAVTEGDARGGTVVSETSSNPFAGITLVERIEQNPNNRIYVAYISLCTDYLHMAATRPPSSLRTPGSWAGVEGVQLATNGDFFATGPLSVYGDAVGFGQVWPITQTGNDKSWAWYYQNYGWIAFGPDWVEFNHTERTKLYDADRFSIGLGWRPSEVTTDKPGGTVALVSGFPELVIEGQTYTCSAPDAADCFPDRSDMSARHPRTAMGLTEDRATFILAVVDGRDAPASVGMYGTELAELMAALGAWEAFNLDGGGSSAMWVEGQGYVNQPSDGSARSVGNHWGVFAGAASGQAQTPGSCFVPGGCFATPLAGALAEPFVDMPPASYAHDEAIALKDAGITSGCSTDPPMFCPACTLSRAQAVTFLIKAAGITPAPPATPTFDDVDVGDWFFPFVEAASDLGITAGCSATSFCPNDPVLRGQLAAFVQRTLSWPLGSPATPSYPDVAADHLFFGSIEALAERCISEGCEGPDFCPDDEVTRGEAAVVVARSFGLLGEPGCGGSGTGGGGGSGAGAGASGGSASGGGAGAQAAGVSSSNDGLVGDCGCRLLGEAPSRGEANGWRWIAALAAFAGCARLRSRGRRRHRA